MRDRARLALLWLLSWAVYALYFQGQWVYGARPIIHITGDEPHYLVIATSLLRDGDLDVLNNYRDKDYFPFYPYHLGDARSPEDMHAVYGRDGGLYSKHSLGLPLALLPAMRLGGHGLAILFMISLTATLSLQTYLLARDVTPRPWAARGAWIAVAFSAPLLLYADQLYPEVPGALLTVIGVRAVLRAGGAPLHHSPAIRELSLGPDLSLRFVSQAGPIAFSLPRQLDGAKSGTSGRCALDRPPQEARQSPTGTALRLGISVALLPWLHLRYVPIAVALVAAYLVILFRSPAQRPTPATLRRLAPWLLTPPALAGLLLFLLNWRLFGGVLAVGEFGTLGLPNLLTGLPGLLLDRQFGLLVYAPIYLIALLGLPLLPRRLPRSQGGALLGVLGVYVLFIAAFSIWYGAYSPPSRMLVPIIPLLVAPLALALERWTSRRFRLATGALLLLSWSVAHLLMDVPRLRYNQPTGSSEMLVYLSDVWGRDLTGLLPSFIAPTPAAYAWAAVSAALFWAIARSLTLQRRPLLTRIRLHLRPDTPVVRPPLVRK